jgi:hypothetical protein
MAGTQPNSGSSQFGTFKGAEVGNIRLRVEGVMNNSSLLTADRMTHLKIVVVSLVCATLVAGLGVAARIADATAGTGTVEATVLKVGKPVTAATAEPVIVR